MSGILFLLGAAFFGIGLVRRCPGEVLTSTEQACWGLGIGWSGATAIAYGVVRLASGLTFTTAFVVTLLIWGAALVMWLPSIVGIAGRKNRLPRLVFPRAMTPLLMLWCVLGPIFVRLFVTHMLQVRSDGGIYSGGESTSYDMAFHAAITNAFVYGHNYPPIYTPMPPAPLLYPFLPDFLTAFLVALGLDLHSALVWTSVPLCLSLTGIVYCFALRFLSLATSKPLDGGSTNWLAAIATLLFFFNGGLGFLDAFYDWRSSGLGLWQFLSTTHLNYTHIAEKGLVWPNIITDMLLPQRGSLFGLSLGLIVLSLFAIAWQSDGHDRAIERWGNWRVLFAAGVITGLLPLFHVHSYVAVGFIGGFLFLFRPRGVWLAFWIPAVLIAAPQLISMAQLAGTGLSRFQPGWRGQGESSWLLFWLRNVGVPTLLIIPAWLMAPRSLQKFYVGFIALLVLALLVVLSPNDYDNLKLMVYWYAGTCVVIAGWLGRLAQSREGHAVSTALVALSICSGALAIASEWRASKLLFTADQVAAAEFVKGQSAPHALFLTAPSLHHPVLSLAGRRVVRGPTPWLWSHGYPFAEREADVRAIYAGADDATELLRYYRVDYVYLGENEATELGANRAFFDGAFPAVYRAGNISIYDTRKLRAGDNVATSTYQTREYASRVDRDPAQLLAEFPKVAYRLYRLHEVAFGGVPRYVDFMSDLKTLGRDLYVGAPGWEEKLKENTRILCDEWTTRPAFRERFQSLSDRESVTALLANAKLDVPDSKLPELVAALASGRETRASVLLRITEDKRLYGRDYNAAYLLCHYFGYLHRNPDDAPDRDLTGYNFWLAQLNRTRDLRGLTRAFIEAGEYKRQPARERLQPRP